MLHMLTWDESSLDQLNIYSVLMFNLEQMVQNCPISFGYEKPKQKRNINWDYGSRQEDSEAILDIEYDSKIQEAANGKLLKQLCILGATCSSVCTPKLFLMYFHATIPFFSLNSAFWSPYSQ